MSSQMFKIKGESKSLEQIAEILKANLNPKFEITVERNVDKNAKGFKKLLNSNAANWIKIKKNGYHGIMVSATEPTEGMDYQVVSWGVFTPNWMIDQVMGHTGLVDVMIGKLIFGNGKDLYDKTEEIIKNELGGEEVNNSIMNNVKQMFKGKTVLDE